MRVQTCPDPVTLRLVLEIRTQRFSDFGSTASLGSCYDHLEGLFFVVVLERYFCLLVWGLLNISMAILKDHC